MAETTKMWQCQMPSCGYIYNAEKGCKKNNIEKGIAFSELPPTYKCPLCGAGKNFFQACD